MRNLFYLCIICFSLLLPILFTACGVSPNVSTQIPTETVILISSPIATSTSTPNATSTDMPTSTLTPSPFASPTSTPSPTSVPSPTSAPSPTLVPDTGWEGLRAGLERRIINLVDDDGKRMEHVYLLRLEPDQYRFDVEYDAKGKSLEGWQAENGALLVVNGGFFSVENKRFTPNGLTVLDGESMGVTYRGFGGMLAITERGPEVRGLVHTPYNPDEELLAALQSFPLLVKPGGEIGFPEQHEDGKKGRRTVMGQDHNGRLLFMVTPRGHFTLHQLSVYLTESDLELDVALNLDGGPSTGLRVAEPAEEVPAFSLLPIVITVYER